MLLTLTTTHRPATDLGFLLHKHPERVQRSSCLRHGARLLSGGVGGALHGGAAARRRPGRAGAARAAGAFALAEYVNDRPYVALVPVGGARDGVQDGDGRSHERPELAAPPIPLEASAPGRAARGGEDAGAPAVRAARLRGRGEPIRSTRVPGGATPLTLSRVGAGCRDLLTHLYVLIPVLDDEKHYWVDDDEVEKLLRAARAGWRRTRSAS